MKLNYGVKLLILACAVPTVLPFGSDVMMFNWLCTEEGIYTLPHPWECTSYVMCNFGVGFPLQCPSGTVFNKMNSICDWPHKVDLRSCSNNPLGLFDPICQWRPRAKLASQLSCAQYFDCSQASTGGQFARYVMECPYPQLFSEAHGQCVHYSMVNCGQKPVPRAPCDYIQYQQLCSNPQTCAPCQQRHPSCVGYQNGIQPVPTINNYYMYCDQERTISIEKCPGNQVFSSAIRRCVSLIG